MEYDIYFPIETIYLFALSHYFLDQSDNALHRIIILTYNNIIYVKYSILYKKKKNPTFFTKKKDTACVVCQLSFVKSETGLPDFRHLGFQCASLSQLMDENSNDVQKEK